MGLKKNIIFLIIVVGVILIIPGSLICILLIIIGVYFLNKKNNSSKSKMVNMDHILNKKQKTQQYKPKIVKKEEKTKEVHKKLKVEIEEINNINQLSQQKIEDTTRKISKKVEENQKEFRNINKTIKQKVDDKTKETSKKVEENQKEFRNINKTIKQEVDDKTKETSKKVEENQKELKSIGQVPKQEEEKNYLLNQILELKQILEQEELNSNKIKRDIKRTNEKNDISKKEPKNLISGENYLTKNLEYDNKINQLNRNEIKLSHEKDIITQEYEKVLLNEYLDKEEKLLSFNEYNSENNVSTSSLDDEVYFYLNNKKLIKIENLPDELLINLYINEKYIDYNNLLLDYDKINKNKTVIHLKDRSDLEEAKKVIINVYSNKKEIIQFLNFNNNIQKVLRYNKLLNNFLPKVYVNYKNRTYINKEEDNFKNPPNRTNRVNIPHSTLKNKKKTLKNNPKIKFKRIYPKFKPNIISKNDNLDFIDEELDLARTMDEKQNKKIFCKGNFVPYEKYSLSKDINKHSIEYMKLIIKKVIDKESPIHGAVLYIRVEKIFNPIKFLEFNKSFKELLEKLVNNDDVVKDGKFFISKKSDLNLLKPRIRLNPEIIFVYEYELLLSIVYTKKLLMIDDEKEIISEAIKNMGFEKNPVSIKEYERIYNSKREFIYSF